MISSATGLSGINGILGLSPADKDNGPSYMKALQKSNDISEYKVSFQLNHWTAGDSEYDNYADFGTPVSSRSRGDTWHAKLNKKNDQWWTLPLNGFSYGSDSMMSGVMKYAIVDTGTSLLYMVPSDFKTFKSSILSAAPSLTCTSELCYSVDNTCDVYESLLSPIKIHLGQVLLTIPPNGYMLNNTLSYSCLIAISNAGSDSSPYILGDTFIRNYYTTFDYKKSTVSFAVSSNAPDGVKVDRDFTTWAIVGIVASVLVGVVICAFVANMCFKWKKRRQMGIVVGGSNENYYQRERLV